MWRLVKTISSVAPCASTSLNHWTQNSFVDLSQDHRDVRRGAAYSAQKVPLIQRRRAAYSAHQGPLIQWAAYRPQAARAMAAAKGRGYQVEGLMCSLPSTCPLVSSLVSFT